VEQARTGALCKRTFILVLNDEEGIKSASWDDTVEKVSVRAVVTFRRFPDLGGINTLIGIPSKKLGRPYEGVYGRA